MNYVYVGNFIGTHGIKGELKLKTSFLYKNKILKEDFCFFIGNSKTKYTLLKSRNHNGIELLTFKDYEDINLVIPIKNEEVYVLREDLSLKPNEYVFEDYIGLKAYNQNNFIGEVKEIINYGNNNNVFHIEGDKEVLIPLNEKFIDNIVLNDKIVFKEVEGIIDAN